MSEWDYLPTPYETLVESETKHSLLILMSIGCLLEGKVIHPIDVFEIAKNNSNFNDLLNREVKSECYIRKDKIVFSGKTKFTILYAGEDDMTKIFSIDYFLPFNHQSDFQGQRLLYVHPEM